MTMKFTMPQKVLADAIKTVLPAVSTKNTIPILSGIYIDVPLNSTETVWFRATDMEVSVRVAATGKDVRQGHVIIEAKRLATLVNRITGDVTVEVNPVNGHAWIRWEKSKAELMAWSGEQFPDAPSMDNEQLTMRSNRFARLLDQTLFTVSTDETKPYLCGVNMDIRDGRVAACATNGVAIALWKGELEVPRDVTLRELIPHKAGQLLCRYLPDTDTVIRMGTGQNHLIFELPNLTLTSRTIEGKFPDVERMIPSEYPLTVRVQREELIKAMERAAPFGNNGNIRWQFTPGVLIVTARSDAGNIEEPIACDYSGLTTEIGFDVKVILPGLKAFSGDTLDIEMLGSKNPARIRSAADPELSYIALPLIAF